MPQHLTEPDVTTTATMTTGVIPAQTRAVTAEIQALQEAHKQAIFGVFSNFYRELSGKWQTSTVLVDIWQGPNAVMVGQLNADPMSSGVAKSLISMLATIVQSKPEPNARVLAESGALEALYSIAFNAPERLDLLPFTSLPYTTLSQDESRSWVRCCISLLELPKLLEPVVIRTDDSVHLFEFAALKQVWRESFRYINPMSRKTVLASQVMRLERFGGR